MNLRILAPDYLNDNSFTMRKQMHVCLEEERMRRGNAKEDLSWHLLGVSGEMKEVFRWNPIGNNIQATHIRTFSP